MTKHAENIKAMLLEGQTVDQIVSTLGCSRGTVGYHRNRLGLTQKIVLHPIDDWLPDYESGMPLVDICKKHSMSLRVIYNEIDAGHIEKRPNNTRNNGIIEAWLSGKIDGHNADRSLKPAVRRYILARDGNACTECGFSGTNPYTGNTILQIDHIDGDSGNSSEYNLRTLCPNCHAMTETYGALNKGNGRPNRYK